MEKKYILTNEKRKTIHSPRPVYRIQAIRDFDDVKSGDLGGFVSDEYILSHEKNCWIYDNAIVCGNSSISDNAKLYNNSVVKDGSLYEDVRLYDNTKIYQNTVVWGKSEIKGNVSIFNTDIVTKNIKIQGDIILDGCFIGGTFCDIKGNFEIHEHSFMDASITSDKDYKRIDDIFGENTHVTWIRSNNTIISDGKSYTPKEFIREFNEWINPKARIIINKLIK